jgi:hypothetical protein
MTDVETPLVFTSYYEYRPLDLKAAEKQLQPGGFILGNQIWPGPDRRGPAVRPDKTPDMSGIVVDGLTATGADLAGIAVGLPEKAIGLTLKNVKIEAKRGLLVRNAEVTTQATWPRRTERGQDAVPSRRSAGSFRGRKFEYADRAWQATQSAFIGRGRPNLFAGADHLFWMGAVPPRRRHSSWPLNTGRAPTRILGRQALAGGRPEDADVDRDSHSGPPARTRRPSVTSLSARLAGSQATPRPSRAMVIRLAAKRAENTVRRPDSAVDETLGFEDPTQARLGAVGEVRNVGVAIRQAPARRAVSSGAQNGTRASWPTTTERNWAPNRLGAAAWWWHSRNCAWPCSISSSQACMLSEISRIGPNGARDSRSRIHCGKKVKDRAWVAAKRRVAASLPPASRPRGAAG